MFEIGVQLRRERGAENVFDYSIGNPDVEPPEAVIAALYLDAGLEKTRAFIIRHILEPELDRINAMDSKAEVIAEIIRLHRAGIPVVFNFGAGADAKDSARTIAELRQGGLSMADREYYLKTDAKSVETRNRFQQHVEKMFQLVGDSEAAAASKAREVLEFETILAKASADRAFQEATAALTTVLPPV